jgi:thiosulfate/3-mercaptopyruvate sulfurtransferase
LPDFDSLPTFAYATPHNIQLSTPQNASCEACHGNEALFLTADKVRQEELAANEDVIVDVVPGP